MASKPIWDDMHNTEDKQAWTLGAEAEERDFVKRIAPPFGINVVINPEKATNPYVPDLLIESGQLADLKKQTTPFFTANRYGVPPQYAVTFNEKDYERYSRLYPNIYIFFWIRWERCRYPPNPNLSVQPMEGVWGIALPRLAQLLERGVFQKHAYQRRLADTRGNAKVSYILDLRKLELQGLIQISDSEGYQ